MNVQRFEVKVVGGATGSGRSLKLQQLLGSASAIDLAAIAFEKGPGLGLADFQLPQTGTIGIDQATALSSQALESLLLTCFEEGRCLLLGTQDLEATAQACSHGLARHGIMTPVIQIAL